MPENAQATRISAALCAVSYCRIGSPAYSSSSVMNFARGGGAPRNGLAAGGHGAAGVVSAVLGFSAQRTE